MSVGGLKNPDVVTSDPDSDAPGMVVRSLQALDILTSCTATLVVLSAATSGLLLAANPNRKRFRILVVDTNPAYIHFGDGPATAANTATFLKRADAATENLTFYMYEEPLNGQLWRGAVYAISTGGTNVLVTEWE